MIDALNVFGRGFALSASLIVAIGAQNAFILERGLARNHVLVLCVICALMDAVLIAAGVAGLGTLIAANPSLVTAVALAGAVFLYGYAILALRRMMAHDALTVRTARILPLGKAVATCLALTLLNPHVYLDTVLLIGSLSGRYGEPALRVAFGCGAAVASFVWFFALGYGARLLAPLFERPAAWRVLDGTIAVVMAMLATSLLIGIA